MHPAQNTVRAGRFRRLLGGVAIVGALAVAGSIATGRYLHPAQATAAVRSGSYRVSKDLGESHKARLPPLRDLGRKDQSQSWSSTSN